jgi:hypothetical protein
MNILDKSIVEAIRSAYAAPTPENISSKSEERQGVMARTQSKVSSALKDTAQDAMASIQSLVGKTMEARTDKDVSMEELAKQSAEENAKYRESMGITQSLTSSGGMLSTKDEQESAPVTVETKGAGLMSRKMDGKDGNLAESYDELEMDAYLDEFIPEMAALEGMGGDVVLGDLEPTYSYGITEAKATEYGMQPEDYDNMEDFARAFAARYRKEKQEMYPEIFTADLDKDVEKGLQSYLWNRGSFYPGQLGALSDGNLNGFIDELKDVVNAADTTTARNQSRPMAGLSKRRAAEANLVGRGIEGYVPVATVETTGTQQNPIFIWKDARGNEVNRFAATKPLHSMSTMGEVAVPT